MLDLLLLNFKKWTKHLFAVKYRYAYRIFILFCFRFTDANLSFTNRSYYQPYQNSTSYPPIIWKRKFRPAESKQLFCVIFEESIIYSILVSFYTRISVIDFYIKLMER